MGNINSKIKHGAHVLLVSTLAGANIATILLLWATCLSTLLSPALHPRVSQAGLLFPIFLGIDLFFVITWIMVSWRWTILPIIGIIGCWGYVRDYCPINLHKQKPKNAHLVLSYNTANFTVEPHNNLDGWEIVRYITESNADIICLQECPKSGKIYSTLEHKMDSLGYHTRGKDGACIFSKYPFIGKLVYTTCQNYGNGSYAWLINMDGDTTLIINNHLQSNKISPEEKQQYGNAITSYDKEKMEDSGRILLSRLSHAAAEREIQTDSLCNLIQRHQQYNIILAGDHNDTPISSTYQRISGLLKSAFTESGNGPGISFVAKGFPVRIDHIFVSHNLNTYGTIIDSKIHASDHRPIRTWIYKSAK